MCRGRKDLEDSEKFLNRLLYSGSPDKESELRKEMDATNQFCPTEQKLTKVAGEAQGIQPLVASSPLMFWLYKVFSLQAVSNLIGVIEIAVAVLIALRPFSARLSFVGSIGAIITFVLTVSFLFSTPGAFQFSHGVPLLGDAGQFLIKDVVLLGASIFTAAEARKEY